MDYNKKTVKELKEICKERGIKGYSSKTKGELVDLLTTGLRNEVVVDKVETLQIPVKTRFTSELLNSLIVRDNAKLTCEYENLNRNSQIEFICSCGTTYKKPFRSIVEKAGALCRKCTLNHMVKTQKETMIAKYGAEHPMKVKQIKDKAVKSMNERSQEQKDKINKKRKATNTMIYGGDCPQSSLLIREKTIKTNMKKYGTKTPLENPAICAKLIATNLSKYGVVSTAQTENVKIKSKNTCMKKYGVSSTAQVPEIKAKQQNTLLTNYGVKNPFQSDVIKEKIKITNMRKYGVEHPHQNSEIFEKAQKSAKRLKEFIMPSGEKRTLQGYEPFAIEELLKIHTEKQISTGRKNVPKIIYSVDAKDHVHYPDIFIPHENKIIEVKSTWTLKCKADNVMLKKNEAEKQGYKYEIWCYNSKGEKTIL